MNVDKTQVYKFIIVLYQITQIVKIVKIRKISGIILALSNAKQNFKEIKISLRVENIGDGAGRGARGGHLSRHLTTITPHLKCGPYTYYFSYTYACVTLKLHTHTYEQLDKNYKLYFCNDNNSLSRSSES